MENRLQRKCAWKVSSGVIKYFSTFASEDSVENTKIKIIHCLYVCQKYEERVHLFLFKNLETETEVEGEHHTKLMALKSYCNLQNKCIPNRGKCTSYLYERVNIKQHDCRDQIEDNCLSLHGRVHSFLPNILSLLVLQRLLDTNPQSRSVLKYFLKVN